MEMETEDFPQTQEQIVMTIVKDNEKSCWGCGLHLILPSHAPVFKCGCCGAITNQKELKHENKYFWCRRIRDRCFVCVLLSFMLFVICGGVWSVSPVVFSVGNLCGIVHSVITTILSVSTISTFSLAAFICAGTPPIIPWGSYPVVGKGHLENYKFCHYCKIPKSPRAHHCRSCGMCILDMDHHCPFIGNCVGAANHRHFILFLISAIISTIYVAVMCSFAMVRTWLLIPLRSFRVKGGIDSLWAWSASNEFVYAISSAVHNSPRELFLVYLFMVSVAVNVGLSMLLWQQLYYIYEGKTYLGHLSAHGADETGEKDCKNLLSFFGCPFPLSKYFSGFGNSRKKHKK